ncbi:hypothetical protein [Siphonobacter sp. BAB-5405]|uniref:hypothetical protein n=1 Tax=Siphonobacter sp. BAB-5405 TaxID=1864825 RepID=UPI001E4C81B0|nr:hypothetical protein [Siphonobacter sp. BAB-5405]
MFRYNTQAAQLIILSFMKKKSILFFSPTDNVEEKKKSTKSKEAVTTSISKKGKLLLSPAVLELLEADPSSTKFKVGTEERKRGVGSFFLVKADDADTDAFVIAKSGRGHGIALGAIFDRVGLDYTTYDYTFEIKPFSYEEEGISGYELSLKDKAPRTAATSGEEE